MATVGAGLVPARGAGDHRGRPYDSYAVVTTYRPVVPSRPRNHRPGSCVATKICCACSMSAGR